MLKLAVFAPGLLLFAFLPPPPAATTDQPGASKAPTSEAITRAKKMYTVDCAMCHGASGDGKGDLVADMKLTLKDYADPSALGSLSDQQLFDIIKDGKGQMPGEGARLKPDDTWAMVYVVRSFSKK